MFTAPVHALHQESFSHVHLFYDRCKRVRNRASQCNLCETICPESAITLKPGPTLGRNCNACGLCYYACPMDVFAFAQDLDRFYLGAALEQLKSSSRQASRVLSAKCSSVENKSPNELVVPCMFSFSLNVLLGLKLKAVREIRVDVGKCDNCVNTQAYYQFLRQARKQRLTDIGVKIKIRNVNVPKAEKQQRRQFSALVGVLGGQVALGKTKLEYAETFAGPSTSNSGMFYHSTPARKQLLSQLLEAFDPGQRDGLKRQLQPMLAIDAAHCQGSSLCTALCPTGALRREVINRKLHILFDSALCSDCGLCQESCPANAIELNKGFKSGDTALNHNAVSVAQFYGNCRVCGDSLNRGVICSACSKRGLDTFSRLSS